MMMEPNSAGPKTLTGKDVTEKMLLLIMRYCDGDLSPKEMKIVAAEIERDPELQALVRDLRLGATAGKSAVKAIGETPIPPKLVRAVLRRPAGSPSALLISSGIRKRAATRS